MSRRRISMAHTKLGGIRSAGPKNFTQNLFAALWEDKSGQDLIEYALTVGFVAVAAAAIFPATLMPNVSVIFSKIESSMAAANGS
jgi:Flp pilus assembly pilin Flp